MLVCKVKNLFGENGYYCGRMAKHVITVGKINYLPLDAVRRIGLIIWSNGCRRLSSNECIDCMRRVSNRLCSL